MFLMIDTRYPSNNGFIPSSMSSLSWGHHRPPPLSSTNSTLSTSIPSYSSPFQTPSLDSLPSFIDIDSNFSAYIDFLSKSLIKYHHIIESHSSVQCFQGLILPASSDMTKFINLKQVPKSNLSDILKPRFLCQPQISSFQNILCDGIVKVSSYLKNNPTTTKENLLVIYIFESQLIESINESEFNSSILKFSRCIEKLCPIYHLKIRLICVKMLNSTLPRENKMIQNIRVLLNPMKEYLLIDTIENIQFYYEYNFKEHIRYNTQNLFAEIELPSLDDTRATLFLEMMGTTLSACDLMSSIYCEHEKVRFKLLCTVPRSGLYPICILGNPIIVTPARKSQVLLSPEEKDNAILFYSLAKHLTNVNTIFILQSFKKPGIKVPPYERQFWALIPPGSFEAHKPLEYQVQNMVLIQLCDQDSFLICSDSAAQISTKPSDPSEIQSCLQEDNDREIEMKEFVETSTQLLESMDIYNPLAFISLKYQPPVIAPPSLPAVQYPPPTLEKATEPTGRISKTSNTLVTSTTPMKRSTPASSSTSKFHAKRVKTRSDTSNQRDEIDEFEY